MPFKGDMRLGGPHDNERTLNGTSSDFDGVPAYGTFLRGPYDTSRTEFDFIGEGYFMPYETNYYANGLGGEYPVEVWGLQYFPAGWRTNRVEVTSYTFEIEYYEDQTAVITYAIDKIDYIEDGTGINYESPFTHYPHQAGDVLAMDTAPTAPTGEEIEMPEGSGTYYYRGVGRISYLYDGAGGYYEEYGPLETYYSDGTPIGAQFPDLTYMPPARMDLENSGEFGTQAQYPNGKYRVAYWNGSGGYYLGGLTGSFFTSGDVYYTEYTIGFTQIPELAGQGSTSLGLQPDEFDNGQRSQTTYTWNGSGGSGTTTTTITQSYYPHGTYIGESNYYYYWWEGNGSYYTSEITPPDPPPEDPPPEDPPPEE